MSFPKYPNYKPSGVEWLGDVPEHWSVTQLKRIVDPKRQITYGIVQAGPHMPDGIPYIRPADMSDENGVIDPENVLRTTMEIARSYIRSTIQVGDIVCSIGPSFGKVMITPTWLDGANLTQGTSRIAVHSPSIPRYIFWVLRSKGTFSQWESSVGGATFRALNLGPLSETVVPIPTSSEQTAIASFLDRETSKIDSLVAEQRRLIELLKEKRQAVISHAVTKGLNPHAPMKPSGIEWLGDVPEHWVVGKLHYSARLKGGFAFAATSFGTEGIFVVRMNNLKRGRLDLTDAARIPGECCNNGAALKAGDLLWGMSGSIGETGSLGNYARVQATDLPCQLNQRVGKFVVNSEKLLTDFLVWMIQTSSFYEQVILLVTGTAQFNVSSEQVESCLVALPSVSEQSQISEFLVSETSKFDALTAEAERAIELLQERRTALISAAVTGKIDVRTLQEAN